MNSDIGWDKVLEEQSEKELEPTDLDQRLLEDMDRDVLEVSGGTSAYANHGVLSSDWVENCIVLAAHDYEGQGYMNHLVASTMSDRELAERLQEAKMHVSRFTGPGGAAWFAAGGKGEDPDYTREASIGIEASNQAAVRRHRVDNFFSGMDYDSEWLGPEDGQMTLLLDVDRDRFIYSHLGDSELREDRDYLRW